MGRPPCCDKVGIKKGPWTPEEDIILVSYIQEHGPGNWRAVPTHTGLMRCSKSCRLRWTNYLRPGIKRGNFTPHEEGMIIHLQALLGNKWAAIATYLPQRTDNDIKNYWNTHLKKKLKKLQGADNLRPPQMMSSNHPFMSKSYGERANHQHTIKNQTSARQSHHHENSSVYYASSEENISRLLEGWMQSSPSPFHTAATATAATTTTTTTTVGPNGYGGRSYRDFEQTPGEGSGEAMCYRPQGIENDEGWTTSGMMISDHHHYQEMEAIWTVNHHHHHHHRSFDKSSCDSSHKGSESSGAMDHEEKAKIDVSTPPLSFLEKWLLEESSGGQIEAAAMGLASIF